MIDTPPRVETTPVADTCEIRLLGACVRVSGTRTLLNELQSLFRLAATDGTAGGGWSHRPPVTTLTLRSETPGSGWYQIEQDGVLMWRTNDPHDVLASLEWAVNNAVVKQLGNRYLLFHAGAVARNGSGILLPAIAGSGKTTLVAGLISGGAFDYFSDEVGVVDPSTQMLLPFAKSLSVKDGSRAVLSPMYPWLDDTPSGRRFGGRHVWHLRPPDRTAGHSRVPVRYVVFPHYRADALTRLDPVSRSTALARLMEQSFSLREHGADGMRALVRVLGQAECYTLTIGMLDQAIKLMYRLTGEVCDG